MIWTMRSYDSTDPIILCARACPSQPRSPASRLHCLHHRAIANAGCFSWLVQLVPRISPRFRCALASALASAHAPFDASCSGAGGGGGLHQGGGTRCRRGHGLHGAGQVRFNQGRRPGGRRSPRHGLPTLAPVGCASPTHAPRIERSCSPRVLLTGRLGLRARSSRRPPRTPSS